MRSLVKKEVCEPASSSFGSMLRAHRKTALLSQMSLALAAGVSEKHLSFLENGRTQPSRKMVLRLAEALNLGEEDATILLATAGYATQPAERSSKPEMLGSDRIVRMLLDRHNPYPALALDESWTVIQFNAAAKAFRRAMANASSEMNMARLFLSPDGYRPRILDWERVAGELMGQLRADLEQAPTSVELRRVIARCEHYPGVRAACERHRERSKRDFKSIGYRTIIGELRMYTSLLQVCFPTARSLKAIRIEFFFPADADSAAICEGPLLELLN